jgi:uncharacterized membrane protein YsdA (DUF1294 family)/cold shock CspA family protein
VSQTQRGTIVTWNDARGFGFIRPREGGKDLFFHVSDLDGGAVRPQENMGVSYTAAIDDKGRRCAEDVHLNGTALKSAGWPVAVAVLFFVALGVLSATGIFQLWVPALYLAASIVTMAVYRSDKARAESGAWRTPEKVLHLLELAGGWPGALVAQWHFRHKNRKTSYQVAFWFVVAINLTLLAALGAGIL